MILPQDCRSPRDGSGAPQRHIPAPLLPGRCIECWLPAPVGRRVHASRLSSCVPQRHLTVKEDPGHGPTEPR
jgi:hypothetical protein